MTCARNTLVLGFSAACLAVLLAWPVQAAISIARQGGEYAIAAPLTGDQMWPGVSLGAQGGYLVWQDNTTDGNGLGISGRRLDANQSGNFGVFRVNEIAAGDQERPQVAMLRDGGAIFAWQSGPLAAQRIYARFAGSHGQFVGGDVQVNTYAGGSQSDAAVAGLSDGGAVVVWSSFGQDGSMWGVYGQRFTATGQKIGSEFLVNQTTSLNQRDPALTALPGGGFAVVWISEKYKGTAMGTDANGRVSESYSGATLYDVHAFIRLYGADGQPKAGELAISPAGKVAANPTLACLADGSLLAAWSSRAVQMQPGTTDGRDRWDIVAARLTAAGAPNGQPFRVNLKVSGDQFRPRLTAVDAGNCLAVWSSLAQDGAREGVFGRWIGREGAAQEEMLVNTTTASQQVYPALASDPNGRALVVWSSYVGGAPSFDVYAQRYSTAPALAAPAAPYVLALGQTSLSVAWSVPAGLDIAGYEVYIDEATSPTFLTESRMTLRELQPASSHTVRVAYWLADGRRSPISEMATGRTWGQDANVDKLPDDWQALYWPGSQAKPGALEDSDGDGGCNLQEFLAGTNPVDPQSALRTALQATDQGPRLGWETQPGCLYQVQVTQDLATWSDLGSPRFAMGAHDSIPVDGSLGIQMYRIIRVR